MQAPANPIFTTSCRDMPLLARHSAGGAARRVVLALALASVTLAATPAPPAPGAPLAAATPPAPGPAVADDFAADECAAEGGEDDGSCELSLRQLRGERIQAAALTAPNGGPGPYGFDMSDLNSQLKAFDDVDAVDEASDDADSSRGIEYKPWNAELVQPSGAPLFEFYMYRAVSDETYAPLNVNTASLGGVLWYLQHEVVIQYPRKFGISRIKRMKVQMRATDALVQLGMHFGPRFAFDKGQCTGPFVCGREEEKGEAPQPKFCDGGFEKKYEADIMAANGKPFDGPYEWSKFGYFVGCNKLGSYPFPMYEVYYENATWYSLPGPCPSKQFNEHSKACVARQPGGMCKGEPTGAGDCTWSYEEVGEVLLDDLIGISVDKLHKEGGREYNPLTDKGTKLSFWNGINTTSANTERMKALTDLFEEKYPKQTRDEALPPPPCDFNFGVFYKEFWWKAPFSGKCAKPSSKCYDMANWGKTDGIYGHPEWYPGLTADSPIEEFIQLLYMQGKEDCPHRPCGIKPEEPEEPQEE